MKNISVAILLVIVSLFWLSSPSFAESLKELNVETSDFAVKVYRKGETEQIHLNIWDIKNKSSIANAQEVKKAEITVIKDVIQPEGNENANWLLEIGKIFLLPLSNLIFVILLVLALGNLILFLLRKNRHEIISLIRTFNITSIGVGEFFTLAFEQSVVKTYKNHALDAPSFKDIEEIRDIVERLAPLVEGKRILWVDDHPENNKEEKAIFTQLGIEVKIVKSSHEAWQKLSTKSNDYALMISDWNREPQKQKNKAEGLRFLEEIRTQSIKIPVIFYHGIVDKKELNNRRNLAKTVGAIGTTGNPGELLKWTIAELVTKSLLP